MTDVTRLYLEQFMFNEFSQSSFTFLDDFVTRMVTSTFVTGAPYVIDYSATARFNPFSTVFPSKKQLDEAIVIAFSGADLQEYISRLKNLPASNVFKGANVLFANQNAPVTQKTGNNTATIAAASVAAALLAAGAVIYKRRSQLDQLEGKNLEKGRGDVTLAGGTVAGETYDGTVSVASIERHSRYRDDDDDDDGTKGHSLLGTIEEGDDDDHSVRPNLGTNLSYVEDFEGQTQEINFQDESGVPDDIKFSLNALDDASETVASNGYRGIRRVATEGSSVVSPTVTSYHGFSNAHSFDEMALQGMSHMESNQMPDVDESSHERATELEQVDRQEDPARSESPEIASLLSHDSMDEESLAQTVSSSHSAMSSSRRPRTIAEIEALLSAETNEADEESQTFTSRSRSFGNSSSSIVTPSRPRTVEEIESLLTAGFDDGDDVEDNTRAID